MSVGLYYPTCRTTGTDLHVTTLDSQTASFQTGGAQTITCSFCEKRKQKNPQTTKPKQIPQTPGGKHPGSILWDLAKCCVARPRTVKGTKDHSAAANEITYNYFCPFTRTLLFCSLKYEQCQNTLATSSASKSPRGNRVDSEAKLLAVPSI